MSSKLRNKMKAARKIMQKRGLKFCVWCGADLTLPGAHPTVDHFLTARERRDITAGGQKPRGELLLACARCNYERGQQSFMEYAFRLWGEDLLV